ncbi:uL15m family ribosomal protein [Haloquadratum walsbyi]|uniref:Large ribosomal subunit protein uL15 n=1 Tax=Haloquadratum walsbyi (strain DSM 16790 / HBSQ001) TaxID=362976 RepID=RL15_HALWD|nr:uL15m family ribosomal protein [Haloquadratum walsbyi]Q18GH1.1 RecName: Full=Large ribosomal subunit protein uL15; AltName: Full=50S ribosomal protein L15 [Haloquadratum walsbyi DSM 16790]CAJ52927.1 50S ribosomal protein L15 [Haloquadratum walsbyi DSM 16790]
MTSKKRRQRGSRTHGGGTHKNRRGAGHRGGRGRAGRDKHEQHNYEPIGKHGFKRPPGAERTVAEISVQELDEGAALFVAEETAEFDDGAYHIDARDIADDADSSDITKVLGDGQVRQELHVIADAFSDTARTLIEDAGGSATLTEQGKSIAVGEDEEPNSNDEN